MNHVGLGLIGVDPVSWARGLEPALVVAADEKGRGQTIAEPLLTRIHEARLARMPPPRRLAGIRSNHGLNLHEIEQVGRRDAQAARNLFVANSSALIAPLLPLADGTGYPR